MHRFLIIIEKPLVTILHIPPDLPGCVATGRTKDQAAQNIHEAIELHILGLKEDHLSIPKSHASAEYIAITG